MSIRCHWLFLVVILTVISSCRHDEIVVPTEYEPLPGEINKNATIEGMYLVNEGNMGSNKCSIDFLDFRNGWYERNIYAARNPHVVKELGDVGNDVQIYGDKLYIVVNCSNKVEVLNARTGVRIGKVDIPNCRNIRFYRGAAYVSSYVGPVQLHNPNAVKGAVYRVDTASLSITGRCTVGYQPDELEVLGQYLYVANSGGYMAPSYDNTVSVIQLEDFKQVDKIPVAINLSCIRADKYGKLWVTSRGNYANIASNIFILKKKSGSNGMAVEKAMDVPCTTMAINGDSLFFISAQWNEATQTNSIGYGVINVATEKVISRNFITDGTQDNITIPYGIAVHPETGDIYVTDAKNYVSSGTLYCYTREGKLKWKVRTGDIPAHMCFLKKRQ